jgi:hypothetical protein
VPVLAAIAVELAVAAGVSDPRFARLVVLLAAVGGLALVAALPLPSAMALLFIAASIFHGSFFRWSVGPLDVHLDEVVFLALVFTAVVAPRRHTWGGAAGALLAVFFAVVVLSAWLAVQAGRVSLTDAFNWGRPLMLYGSFWVVLRLFPDADSMRKLLFAALACGALTGGLAVVLQVAHGLVDTFQGAGAQ